jgi:NADH-quinone oxidoreductase subunit G
MIYDEGSMISKSVALHSLARRPFLEMNAEDAKELGLSEGDEATVSAESAEARLEVVVSDIGRGAVFVPYDQPGLRANSLMHGPDPRVQVAGG